MTPTADPPANLASDPGATFRSAIAVLNTKSADYAVELVSQLLRHANQAGASDIHLQPEKDSLCVRWRLDGVLHQVATLPGSVSRNICARLKVLADLLTYQTDTPQEGRIRETALGIEQRVSTFPTLFGEKVVVRLFAESRRFRDVSELAHPADVTAGLMSLLEATAGAIVIAGPAGSGKTTTLYACLRTLQARSQGARSLVSLEDPIESVVDGVAQSQVNPRTGFDLASGLRAMMRQDPEVIAIGEMRDRVTAEAALGAALTGHLILTTFHAPSAAGVVGRLLDMQIEPYVLRSGLIGILAQRLFRRLCSCKVEACDESQRLGLPIAAAWRANGCAECAGTGYRGRFVLSELLRFETKEIALAVLGRGDVAEIQAAAVAQGMVPLAKRACDAVEAGTTSALEVRRVLGLEHYETDAT